ncbi:MAG: KH domain-containing protein [Eggerthellaceae bacterium]|nr:KH domain-containing protein [Eggerthellaceae bacterium]
MSEQGQDLAGLVESIVTPLVEHEDDLFITSHVDDMGSIVIEIEVNEEDAGKVIGRQGRVIKSIRTLARAAASRNGTHVEVEIID